MPPAGEVSATTSPEEGIWAIRRERIALTQPLLMGVLNVTPDSFSDGGQHLDPQVALQRAREMVEEGAGMIDVGGESTRPGARPVDPREEIARVVPVISLLKAELSVPVSVDTRKAEVAGAALEAGADVVNDVSALRDPAMGGVVAKSRAGLVLMHMRGTPETMQRDPHYDDVAGEVCQELERALQAARDAGIREEAVVVDPGIGFAKNQEHNLQLLAQLERLHALRRPIVVGVSRKTFIGRLLGGVAPAERAVGTAAACVVALLKGARIFRVHDVRVAREALTVAEAIRVASHPA
ncbi:MAG TPA: dihydropteroate synthase [Longimicrobiaceae bacterium]